MATKTDFPVWKTIKLGTHKDGPALLKKLIRGGYYVCEGTKSFLSGFEETTFDVQDAVEEVNLVCVSPRELGIKGRRTLKFISTKAQGFGLEKCPFEVAPQLRFQYRRQKVGEYLRIATEYIPSVVQSDNPVFVVANSKKEGLRLTMYAYMSLRKRKRLWSDRDRFIFIKRRGSG
ncbi:MAG TPA: hypothetical protein VHD69_02030 [Candidatus Paceibacterota bacterium]|nr:hypothetical protein [Candidatus Paceibacterota bacterium]